MSRTFQIRPRKLSADPVRRITAARQRRVSGAQSDRVIVLGRNLYARGFMNCTLDDIQGAAARLMELESKGLIEIADLSLPGGPIIPLSVLLSVPMEEVVKPEPVSGIRAVLPPTPVEEPEYVADDSPPTTGPLPPPEEEPEPEVEESEEEEPEEGTSDWRGAHVSTERTMGQLRAAIACFDPPLANRSRKSDLVAGIKAALESGHTVDRDALAEALS